MLVKGSKSSSKHSDASFFSSVIRDRMKNENTTHLQELIRLKNKLDQSRSTVSLQSKSDIGSSYSKISTYNDKSKKDAESEV